MCCVHDIIEFEKRGIPATVILTEAFRNVGEFHFRDKGMKGHSYVMIPHPVSNLAPDDMRALALRFTDEIARQLKA